MKEIPTVKVIDPDCEGGFRIINESDLTPDDKPFVERGEKSSATPETTQSATPETPAATATPAPVAKAPRIRNRSKK